MKIYVCHSSSFDYKTELYEPLMRELSTTHEIILPHELETGLNSKDIIKTCDVVLAEVSFPSTGQGIELGWADAAGVPIICIHKSDAKPSQALHHIAGSFNSYTNSNNLRIVVKETLRHLSASAS